MKTGNQQFDFKAINNKYHVTIILFVLFTCVWILTNLDMSMLWQDEAETACVSRTILTEGVPKGTDGLNFFSQQEGREYGANYEWKLHPWFQFYWLALFLAFFEHTTFIARFPFAILGIATVIFSFFLTKRLWKDNRTAWFVALAFLFNIFFLLLVRQARYYAPVMLFSIYATWALLDILDGKKYGKVHYVIASLLFFQSQYLFAINFWIASLSYTYLFHRDKLKELGITIGVAALPSIPFLIWILDTPYGETLVQGSILEGFQHGFGQFLESFFSYVFEPIWLILLLPLYFFKDTLKGITKESEQILVFFLLLIVGNILAISLLVPEYHTHYLCAVIPFALILKGRINSWLSSYHIGIPIVIFAAVILYKGDILNYTKELRYSNFVGPVEGMVGFIKRETKASDKIAISFGDLPLKYYLPNRIYGGLAGDLPENLDSMKVIIIRQNAIDLMDQRVQQRLDTYVQANLKKFKAYALNVEDSPFENRENPSNHYYEALLVTNSLTIHKRK